MGYFKIRLFPSQISLKFLQGKYGVIAIGIVLFFVVDRHLQYELWKNEGEVFSWDVKSYYAYLPAFFIENDITLEFHKNSNLHYMHYYWPEVGPNDSRVIKTTSGVALLYLPFFLVSHFTELLNNPNPSGFESTYALGIIASTLTFLLIGLIYLYRVLIQVLKDELSSSITILLVGMGTNLWYYSIADIGMSHIFSFALINVYLYRIVKNSHFINFKSAIFHGLLLGLITLVRPTNFLVLIILLGYSLNPLSRDFWSHVNSVFPLKYVTVSIFGFVLIWLIQMYYWKYVTDSWFYFSYTGERFFWLEPELLKGLFGFRKGWFIYTPLMLLFPVGLYFFIKHYAKQGLTILVFFTLSSYVMFSWWAWWYGGGFGMRPMIDYYGIFAIPIAYLINKFLVHDNKTLVKALLIAYCLGTVFFNRLQTQQYRWGIIHWDGMNYKSYKHAWLRTEYDKEILDIVTPPDYTESKIKRTN